MTVEMSSHSGVLNVLAEGEFTLDEAKRTFLEVVDALVEARSEKILFDGRGVSGDPTFIERFFYGEWVAEWAHTASKRLGHSRDPRFAYVLIPPVLDPRRLGETVAINRGMDVRTFDTLQDAVDWLEMKT